MIWQLDILVFIALIVAAMLALKVRDLLTAVALLAAYSLFAALLFAGLNAVDVAFVEAVLGAGITGVLFVVAVLATTRRAEDDESNRRRWGVLPILVAFFGLMLYASTDLPDRGDPESPAQLGVARAYIEGSIEDTQTPNVVTAVLADYRSMDTFGETLVILTAALAAVLVIGTGRRAPGRGPPDEREAGPEPELEPPPDERGKGPR